jgi:hypothetical protein
VQQMHDALAKLRASQEKSAENQQSDNQGSNPGQQDGTK